MFRCTGPRSWPGTHHTRRHRAAGHQQHPARHRAARAHRLGRSVVPVLRLPARVQLVVHAGGQELSRAELDRLAEAGRPLVRLRDQWVLIDPEEARRAREAQDRKVTPIDALGAVLTGSTDIDGRRVEVAATGWLQQLRDRLADPESADRQTVGQPRRSPRPCGTTNCAG
ncbi:SNF2 helicase-associated domain-containing protein [Streptomyces sp. M10(2022)]